MVLLDMSHFTQVGCTRFSRCQTRARGAEPILLLPQLFSGHTKMDGAVRYLGVEFEDVMAIVDAIEI